MTKTIRPLFSSGGNITVTTSANGTDYETFTSQDCSQLTIANNTGVTIEVQQNTTGISFPVFPYSYMVFSGITNSNILGVRRSDVSTNEVTVNARWEI